MTGPGIEPKDAQLSSTAGQQLGTTYGGADTRALTDFGINKVYAQASGTAYRQYATSSWLDTYTVGGAAGTTVNVSFTFSVDGMIDVYDPYDGANSRAQVNFSISALRGANWSLGARADAGTNQLLTALQSGDRYSELLLTQTTPTVIRQIEPAFYQGVYGYQNVGGLPGAGTGRVLYDETTNIYTVEQQIGTSNRVTRFGATGFQTTTTNMTTFPYTVVTGPFLLYTAFPAARTTRTNLENNYAVLDVARLCPNTFNFCTTGAYPGSDLTVSFDLAAGSTFTLLSSLHDYDLYEGKIDFFHTAKMTGAAVSPGATLTSQSGALTQLADGSYGYAAVLAAVPEPASWAMLIAGFGLVGCAMRNRRRGAIRVAYA
jgi:hypothetical protein